MWSTPAPRAGPSLTPHSGHLPGGFLALSDPAGGFLATSDPQGGFYSRSMEPHLHQVHPPLCTGCRVLAAGCSCSVLQPA